MINLSFHNDEAGEIKDRKPAAQHRDRSPLQINLEKLPDVKLEERAADLAIQKKFNHDDTKEVYDPYKFGKTEKATSFFGIVGHLVVISFGPALLSIPATFIDPGYVIGFVCTIVTVFLYAYCMRMIISSEYELCKRIKKPNMSYIEMVQEAFKIGPLYIRQFAKLTNIIIYCTFLCIWIGGNSVLFLLLTENLQNIYRYFFDVNVSEKMLALLLVIPLVLLCWIPNLKWLVPLSTLANVINVFTICVIYYYVLTDMPPLSTRKPFGDWTGVPLLMGVQLFSINATSLLLPLKNELKFPQKFNAKFGVITMAYVPVCLMYSIFGLTCYIRYGEDTNENVILNLPSTYFNKLVISLYCVGVSCMFPLFSYVSFDIIWNNMLKDSFQKSEYRFVYEYVCRTLIPLSSILFAFVVPNLSLFLSLTGTVGTSVDSLIIPALIEMLIHYKTGKYFLYCKDVIILIVASILIIAGTMNCFTQLMYTLG